MTDQADQEIDIQQQGSLKVVRLTRVRALNALTAHMRAEFSEALWKAARDAQTYAVMIESESEKAFSAGSDVREVLAASEAGRDEGRAMFADEYRMNWQCECFSKPTISLINGLVMGGGVGISLFGTHRIAGPNYQFAMPETRIGLFPDVGVCHTLARMPNSIGIYLGLTGRRIGRSDAKALGLVTHCIDPDAYEPIKAELADAWPVDPILDRYVVDPGPSELEAVTDVIARCFAAPTVDEIIARLKGVAESDRAWAEGVLEQLGTCSPLSLKLTLRHIRESVKRDLSATLEVDYRLAVRLVEGGEFREGVRAMLVDKDNAPKWTPAQVEDVRVEMVDNYFSPLPDDEALVLPSRAEMQEMRA